MNLCPANYICIYRALVKAKPSLNSQRVLVPLSKSDCSLLEGIPQSGQQIGSLTEFCGSYEIITIYNCKQLMLSNAFRDAYALSPKVKGGAFIIPK